MAFKLINIKDRIADIFEKIVFVLNPYFDVLLLSSSDKNKEYLKYMFKCLEIRKELFKTTQNDCLKEKLALTYRNVWIIEAYNYVNKKELLDSALSLLEELLNKHPNDPIYIFLIDDIKSHLKDKPICLNNPFDF